MPQGQIPFGTVTFLFTDIEGSTKLWELHPEQMRVSLARHDELLRQAIAGANGYIFKTIGDAFCAAFATAQDAVDAVVDAQKALGAESWAPETPLTVRMAIHTGAAESRDDDYFGPSVNRTARLLATGHGGQCLLSQTTTNLVRDFLPSGVALKDLGLHQLKDLARPEQVYQILHSDLAQDFPPIRSLSNQLNNLPQQLTSFIGRETETSDVHAMLQKARMVTLTGSGGTGKSRLSLQVAAETLERFPDGAWFVELAPLSDEALVARTIADVLHVKEQPGEPILTSIANSLRHKQLLLILDNCEHLLDPCAKIADHILRTCGQVVILATSREALGISGESAYRVPSLSLPDPKKAQTPTSLTHFAAVRLFVDRAEQSLSTFTVTNQNAPALASLCYHLDGIPLAIELAAARVRSLSVEEIDQKLDQRFRLLTGGSRTALPRQQTLRSLIDWSYDLLNEPEKQLLSRLSVFNGGWISGAAAQVCAGGSVEEWEVLDLITSLCDKSLVVSEQSLGSTRYRLLETVRQYSRDRLMESGEAATWQDHHLKHFTELAEEARPHLRGPEQATWLSRLESEHDNCRAALDWGLFGAGNKALALQLAACLWRFWLLRGHFSEGRHWLGEALAKDPGATPYVRARALNGAGVLAEQQTDFDAAHEYHRESLKVSTDLGDIWCTAMTLNNIGNVHATSGDLERANQFWAQALVLWRDLEALGKLGDQRGFAATLDNLGTTAHSKGEVDSARTYYEECLAIRRSLGNLSGVGYSLLNLAWLVLDQGDFAARHEYGVEGLKNFVEIGEPFGMVCAIEVLAWPSDPLRAARLWGFTGGLREDLGSPLNAIEVPVRTQRVAEARTTLGDESAFDQAWAEGRGFSTEKAVELALG